MSDILTFQIINALQIHPRISWARLGRILNVDPSTISRRWNSLVEDGLIWTSCFEAAGPRGERLDETSALVEIRCRPGDRAAVAAELSRKQQIFSVNRTSGNRDIYVMISTRRLSDMDRFVDDHISSIDGVIATQTHYLRKVFFESSYWRVQYLTPAQVAAIEHLRPDTDPRRPRQEHRDIIAALSGDVRRPAADVQAAVGRSIGSVTRAIESLVASDWVRWRIDFAQSVMGWVAGAVVWLNVPHPMLDKVAAALRSIPNVRMCASVTGPSNLALSLWLRSLEELDEIERVISTSFPHVTVTDRWVVPRTVKRGGYVLDPEGRRSTLVPVSGELIFED